MPSTGTKTLPQVNGTRLASAASPSEGELLKARTKDSSLPITRTPTADGSRDGVAMRDMDDVLEPFRAKVRTLASKVRIGRDPRSEAGPEGITLRQAPYLHAQDIRNKGKSEATIAEYKCLGCLLTLISFLIVSMIVRGGGPQLVAPDVPQSATAALLGLRLFSMSWRGLSVTVAPLAGWPLWRQHPLFVCRSRAAQAQSRRYRWRPQRREALRNN